MKLKYIAVLMLLFFFRQISSAQELSIQTGHSRPIKDLKYNHNNKFMASAGMDNNVVIWDMTTTRQFQLLKGHTKPVNKIDFHHEKQWIASASDDQTVVVWDYITGSVIHKYTFFTKPVKSVEFSPDGKKIACGSDSVYIIDIETETHSSMKHKARRLFDCVTYSNDGKYIAYGGKKERLVHLWKLNENEGARVMFIHAAELKFSADNSALYAAGHNGNLKRIPVKLITLKRRFNIPANRTWHSFFDVAITDKYFVGANRDNLIYIYNQKNGKRKSIGKAHADDVLTIEISSDYNYMVSAGRESQILLWKFNKGEPYVWKILESEGNQINDIAVTKDGNSIFMGFENGTYRMWDLSYTGRVTTGNLTDGKKRSTMSNWNNYIKNTNYMVDNDYVSMITCKAKRERRTEDYKIIKDRLVVWKTNITSDTIEQKLITHKSLKSNKYQTFHLSEGTLNKIKYKSTHNQKKSLLNKNYNAPTDRIFSFTLEQYHINIEKSKEKEKEKLRLDKFNTLKINSDVISHCISESSNYLAYINFDRDKTNTCVIYNISDKNLAFNDANSKLMFEFPIENHYDMVAICPNDKYFYIMSSSQSRVLMYDMATGKELYNILAEQPFIFNENSTLFAYADSIGQIFLCNAENANIQSVIPTNHSTKISTLRFNSKRNFLISAGYDGIIKLWDLTSYNHKLDLAAFDKRDFIYVTKDNYYFGTKNAMKYVGYRAKGKLYPFEQFDFKYNRPDIIFSKLNNLSPELLKAFKSAYYKRLKKTGFTEDQLKFDLHLPTVEIVNLKSIPLVTKDKKIKIDIKAKDTKHEIDRINVWVNSVPIYGMNGLKINKDNLKDSIKSVTLDLSSGENNIKVSATNSKGTESLKEVFTVTSEIPEVKPNLYIISIGASKYKQEKFNLTYASKDASDLIKMFKKNKNKYNYIEVIKIFNEDVTKKNIIKAKEQLMNTQVDDLVVLFFAGHGLLDANLDYFIATYDVDFNNPSEKGLAYDELEGLLDQIPARKKIMLIDACHSGEVDKDEELLLTQTSTVKKKVVFRGVNTLNLKSKTDVGYKNSFELMKELFADLRKGTGAIVISSAGGGEYAYEGEEWNNGVFTYSVIDGLIQGNADLNNDGIILVSELRDYVFNKVSKLTNGQQNPTSRKENLEFDFRIW